MAEAAPRRATYADLEAVPEPLVAVLDLAWERDGERIVAALDAVITPPDNL